MNARDNLPEPARLRKDLGLFDVFAISTGAMFSSGFFLLPGLAAAQAGPSVVLAYLLASFFILPAMFSVAELSTAMPRAGGAYYFLDRSLGPIMGTIGGLGTWLALVLKSAFALVGMGAYLAIYVDVPVKPLAVALTLVFMVVNVVGAKETSGLQRILVTALVAILAFFIVQGLVEVFSIGVGRTVREQFTPFLPFGVTGLVGTIGFVFVSYAGLTKVASVSEEVRNPERNIPLGMILSLSVTTFIYVVGVYIMVAVLNPVELRSDLTPVATAAAAFFDWLPAGAGVVLIVVAAVAAFASTGNAGILSASRYPLAMARDRLVWEGFAKVGRFGTPTLAIVATGVLMMAMIVSFDIEGIAKLASAFQLLLFSLLSFAVIVMRESRIESYDPGYRSPLYPWMQVVGIVAPLWLIAEMGHLAIGFTLGLVALCIGWYLYYARGRVQREGAILHTFARMGESRYEGLELELRGIIKEKGLRTEDPFDEVVARAAVVDLPETVPFPAVVRQASALLAERTGVPAERLEWEFRREREAEMMPIARGAALPHTRAPEVEHAEMVLVRCREGIPVRDIAPDSEPPADASRVVALFFLLSPEGEPGQHLRLLGHLATHVDDEAFLGQWLAAGSEHELRETLLREEHSITLHLDAGSPAADWIGREVRELGLPPGTLIALVRRRSESFVPRGSSVLRAGDRLTVIGEPGAIRALAKGHPRTP
ncbi:MAG TPA: amino acid permease [Longimicrobiaceae bacterium]|nr:amino acid permease [Longimicrobiaceae bacterium]